MCIHDMQNYKTFFWVRGRLRLDSHGLGLIFKREISWFGECLNNAWIFM